MRRLLLIVTLLSFTVLRYADVLAAPVVQFGVGANGVWYDATVPMPSDFEAAGNGSVSLSPHISAVGGAYYGFEHRYTRGSVGLRFTTSNADDPYFSVSVGGAYHFSSNESIRPGGIAPEVSVGWVPWPKTMSRVSIVSNSSYNLRANQAFITAGVRLRVGGGQ